MAAKNIIKTYNLADKIRVLKVSGKSDEAIAEILNREDLAGKDSISQPTVSRFVKKDRKLRERTSRIQVEDYLVDSIPADLKLLDEAIAFHLKIFRSKLTLVDNDGNVIEKSDYSLNDRRIAARDILAIVSTKMKFVGVDPGSGDDLGESGLDLDKYRTEIRKDEGGNLKPEGLNQ